MLDADSLLREGHEVGTKSTKMSHYLWMFRALAEIYKNRNLQSVLILYNDGS